MALGIGLRSSEFSLLQGSNFAECFDNLDWVTASDLTWLYLRQWTYAHFHFWCVFSLAEVRLFMADRTKATEVNNISMESATLLFYVCHTPS